MLANEILIRVLKIALIGLIVVALVSIGSARNREAYGFSLQLAPSQNALQPGEAVWTVGAPVFVIVTMINDSKHIVHYSLTNPAWDYEMDVWDSSGKPAPETEQLRKLKRDVANGIPVTTRNILGTLKPHETAQDTIEVSYFCDVSHAGQYSIQVQREFSDVGKGVVKSNRLDLTITP